MTSYDSRKSKSNFFLEIYILFLIKQIIWKSMYNTSDSNINTIANISAYTNINSYTHR